MIMLLSLFSLLFLIQEASTVSSECGSACQYPLSQLQFEGTDETAGFYVTQCTATLVVQSTFLCMRHYCTGSEITAGLSYLNNNCEEYGDVSLLPWSAIGNITDEEYLKFPNIQYENLSSYSTVYATPVFIDTTLYEISYRTMVDWDESLATRAHYGYALYGFFAGLIAISLTYRLFHFVPRHWHQSDLKLPVISTAFRKSFFLPLIPQSAWGRVPPQIESITIAVFIALNVVLCCVSYKVFDKNLYWSSTRTQLWRYLADRSGVLSIANVPLIWAFGTRNSILIWITGWSYSTFNSFHRWVARVATIEAIIHSIAYTVLTFRDGGSASYVESWTEQYWWMGAIATICMSVMSILAMYPLRRHTYDMFLILHIAFAVFFIISLWYHVAIMSGEYNGYIWPCVAIWAADRILRVGRVLFLNRIPFMGTAIYDKSSDSIRLRVPVHKWMRPQAGSHYFLYVLHGWKPWENHPFTLMSWQEVAASNNKTAYEFSFLISPRQGMTRNLQQRLSTQCCNDGPETTCPSQKLRVVIEGPYGSNHNISQYPAVLLIAGGSGITATISHLRAIHQQLEEDTDQRLHTRYIHFVWAVRDPALFQDIYRSELVPIWSSSKFSSRIELSISIHVTGRNNTSDIGSPYLADNFDPLDRDISTIKVIPEKYSSASSHPEEPVVNRNTTAEKDKPINISVGYSRPMISSVVLNVAEKCTALDENLAVVSCGPESMANDVCQSVADALEKGHDKVHFFPETFYW